MGYSYVLVMAWILFFNVGYMSMNMYTNGQSAKRKAANQKAYETSFKNFIDAQSGDYKKRTAEATNDYILWCEQLRAAMFDTNLIFKTKGLNKPSSSFKKAFNSNVHKTGKLLVK